jgi:hypothetical protein
MSEKDEVDELKKLPPALRIKRLKEIQEKNKQEIEKAQKLIKTSETEEAKERELEKIPIPQLKAANIDQLFTAEEKALFREARQIREQQKTEEEPAKKKGLESIAQEASRQEVEQARMQVEYLKQQPADELKERISNIYNVVKETGYINSSQQEELLRIDYATREKMKDIEAGKYSDVGREAANAMIVTERIKNWLMDKYQAGTIYKRTD